MQLQQLSLSKLPSNISKPQDREQTILFPRALKLNRDKSFRSK